MRVRYVPRRIPSQKQSNVLLPSTKITLMLFLFLNL